MADGNNVFMRMLETIEANVNNDIRNFCQQKLAFPLLFYRIINKSQQNRNKLLTMNIVSHIMKSRNATKRCTPTRERRIVMDKTHYTLCALIEPTGKTIRISKLLSGELGDMLDFIEAGAAATRTKASVSCWRAGCKNMVSSIEFDYRPEETEIPPAFAVRHGSEGQKPLDNPTLAQMCYYVRSSFGLTQREMGEKLGVGQSMVCRIESGDVRGEYKWSSGIKQMYEQLTAEPWTPPTAFQIKEAEANG